MTGRFNYSNVIATIALVATIGGGVAVASGGGTGARDQFARTDRLIKQLTAEQEKANQAISSKLTTLSNQVDSVDAAQPVDASTGAILQRIQDLRDDLDARIDLANNRLVTLFNRQTTILSSLETVLSNQQTSLGTEQSILGNQESLLLPQIRSLCMGERVIDDDIYRHHDVQAHDHFEPTASMTGIPLSDWSDGGGGFPPSYDRRFAACQQAVRP